MATVPTVLLDWVPGPFILNTKKCGWKAKFSGDNSVVERESPEGIIGGCVTYTANPLPLGQVWQTTILSTTWKWDGGLVSGKLKCTLFPVMPEGMDCHHFYLYMLIHILLN